MTPLFLAFSGKHNITTIRRIGVYITWLKDEALYIGCSRNVYKRITSRKRDQPGRFRAFAEADCVEVYPCDSFRQAQQLETELIGIYQPKYNGNGQFQSSYSFQRLRMEHDKAFA